MIHKSQRSWLRIGLLFAIGVCFLGYVVPLPAQEGPRLEELKEGKTLKGFKHVPSESQFLIPKGWDENPRVETSGQNSFLTLRQHKRGIEVVLSWSPLRVKWGEGKDEAVGLEKSLLEMLYGADKIKGPAPAKSGDKTGYQIHIDDGPARNGKEVGVVYFFETGPNEKERWKVKLRATVPRLPPDERAKALKDVESLLEQFVMK